jgi:hypothetical protein
LRCANRSDHDAYVIGESSRKRCMELSSLCGLTSKPSSQQHHNEDDKDYATYANSAGRTVRVIPSTTTEQQEKNEND